MSVLGWRDAMGKTSLILVSLFFCLIRSAFAQERSSFELTAGVGHSLDVLAAAFSSDGRFVVTGGAESSVKLWEVATGRLIRTFSGQSERVEFVSFIESKKLIVAAGSDGRVSVWKRDSGSLVRNLDLGDLISTTVTTSESGLLLAGGRESVLWDLTSGARVRTIFSGRYNQEGAESVGLTTDGGISLLQRRDGTVRAYYNSTGELASKWQAEHSDEIERILKPTSEVVMGEGILAKTKDATLGLRIKRVTLRHAMSIVDLPSGRLIRNLGQSGSFVISTTSASAAPFVLVTRFEQRVAMLSLATGALQRQIADSNDGEPAPITIADDGRSFVSTSAVVERDGTSFNRAKFWDANTGKVLRELKGPEEGGPKNIAITKDLARATIYQEGGEVDVWDLKSGRKIRSFQTGVIVANVSALSRDGKTLIVGDADGLQIKVWDTERSRAVRTIKLDSALGAAALSADGRVVYVGYKSGAVEAREISGATVRPLFKVSGAISALLFDDQSSQLAAGTDIGQLVVSSVATGSQPVFQDGHSGRITTLTFANGGIRLVTGGMDGQLKIWDIRNGRLLATCVLFSTGDWAAITPEGFFDASDNGAKLLSVVQGLDVYSVDQFYRSLHRPDLVREKLAGDPNGLVREAAAKLDLNKAVATGRAPKVVVGTLPSSTAERAVAVDAIVTDDGGGIGQVEWRINGAVLGLAKPNGSDRVQTLRKNLALAPGENRIEVVAYNARGVVASTPAQVTVRSTRAASTKPPKLYILAAGVNAYQAAGFRPLKFAKADATALGAALQRAGGRLYESVEVTTLFDQDVTAPKLDEAFTRLAAKVTPDDVFVLFLSGHGVTTDGRFYYVPQDYAYGKAEVTTKAISQDQLQEWFVRIPAQRAALVVDACESGSLAENRVTRSGIEQYTSTQHLNESIGRAVLSATTDDKPAIEGFGAHGVFTYALLQGLSEGDANGDGMVDVKELGDFVHDKVPELTFLWWGLQQVPQSRLSGASFSLVPKSSEPLVAAITGSPPVIPVSATHTLIGPTATRQFSNGAAIDIVNLDAGAKVRVIQTKGEWDLVARDGKIIGYVEADKLKAVEGNVSVK